MAPDRENAASDNLPTVAQIHAIHEEVVNEYNLTHDGIQAYFPDRKIQEVIDAASQHTDPHRRAAELLWNLGSRHIYADGNKRTSWLAALDYLDQEGYEVPVVREEASRVLKHRARYDVEEFAEWLRSGEIDRSKLRDE